MAIRKVFLVDGTALCYRAFYAIRTLTTSRGRPTNAVYGVAMMLQTLRDTEHPEYMAVAFDAGKPTFRHHQFAAYKEQRKPMPELLVAQLPTIKALCEAYRLPRFELEGYEAEDLMGTMAKQVVQDEVEVWLVTADKDALQLVNSHVKVYNPYHKDQTMMDAEAVAARYGVGPERMVDLMALMGDEIDNIPGVPGIGEKTAGSLLKRFGTLEALYEHVDQLEQPMWRERLTQYRDQVMMARDLARINVNAPVQVTLDELRVQEPDWLALRQLFRVLEFKRLLQAIDTYHQPSPSATLSPSRLLTEAQLETWRQETRQAGLWAVSVWPRRTPEGVVHSLVLALARDPQRPWVVEVSQAEGQGRVRAQLASWLTDAERPKVFHQAKLASHLLKMTGLPLQGIVGDVMIAAHLLNPATNGEDFGELSETCLHQRLHQIDPSSDALDLTDEETVNHLGAYAAAIRQLHDLLLNELKTHQLDELYTTLEVPLVSVLAVMEDAGIALDVPYLVAARRAMDVTLLKLTEDIYQLAGGAFNVNSPKQLAQVLFDRLKLPVIKRMKTGPSTDSGVLQQLAEHHPLPKRLMEYRELSKLVSTYVEALPKLVNPLTGRLHTTLNQTATATGRLSSSEPNLQNIPVKTELGRSIRRAFIASDPAHVLLAADYSQIELRILAHLSHDPHLMEAFHQGHDIHRATAALIYGLPEAEIQPQQRDAMKAINYGILYGMSPHGLSKELGISHEEAQAFIQAYFDRYPSIREYLDQQVAFAKREGFVRTLLGRRRYIPELTSPDPLVRQFGERMAINAPIQGTAADLIKRAMIQMVARLAETRLPSQMVLQVHDELVFETPRSVLEALISIVRPTMEQAMVLDVPLVVTMKVGPNWLDLKSP